MIGGALFGLLEPLRDVLTDFGVGRARPRYYGILAEFESARDLYHACEAVRDAGYTSWDAHAPFPVHGLERAMGLKTSPLPFIAFAAGMAGSSGALLLQWWISAVDYKLVISGKPFFSWPAFIPITFELGVLFAALASLLGMLALNKLPRHHHPLFSSARFERASDDRFYISIEAADPKFDMKATRELLDGLHPSHVEMVES
jgi:hypothetical protein